MTAARAMILDFGGVISRTLFETHPLTEAALGLAPGTLSWRGPFDPESDALWRAMQADQISERDYWQQRTREVAALVGADWTGMADFVRAARGASPEQVIRPEFLETLALARLGGIRLAVLSNELDLFYGAQFRTRLPFLAGFECIHDATHTGILKPDARAYQACLDELGLPAQQCVFVDDQARNIRGAIGLGLQTVHFDVTQPARSYRQVRQRLGLPGT
ncbi:MAG: HAD-IA family hydrolase [Burkholderiaceae bacterium]